MNKTNVTFYRGCHGMGILIEVKYDKDRVIFDFGAPFNPLSEIYDGEVRVRDKGRVKDAIFLDRTKPVKGIFAKEDIQGLDLESFEESDLNTAILICHLHLDHMSEIDKVHPSIPVYIHRDGLKMQELIDEMEENKVYRTYSGFEYGDVINVGCIKVTTYFSDHPCAGSASFLIETPDSKVLYSGDVRYHGVNRDKAFKVMEKFNDKDIDLLIVDSTTTSPSEFILNDELKEKYNKPSKDILPGSILEQDIYEDTYNSLKDFDGIGVFNMYPRDISMLKNMYELGPRLNRTTLFEPYYANILYTLTGIKPTVIEPVNANHKYIDELRKVCEFIKIEDVAKEPNKYLLQNSYRNILNLIDLDGINGKYFHLLGEPLVAGTKEYNIMCNFVNKLNWEFKTYINLYSFSHAYPNHLAYVIEKVNAKSVVAVHSKHPENLNPMNSKQYFPIEAVEYTLENGELKEH